MKESRFKSRDVLMEESLNEFCENNYENASLNRIIKNAKVSKGSFYYHFKNKEDLYQHLLKRSVEAKWAFISQYTKEHTAEFEKMDIFDKFLYQAKAGLLFAEKYPRYNKLANMFVKEKGTPIYDKMVKVIGVDSSELLKLMIREAYAADELDKSFTLEFLISLLENLFAQYDIIFKNTEGLERNMDGLNQFVRFLKTGLGTK